MSTPRQIRQPRPPAYISTRMRRFWVALEARYVLLDHHRELLRVYATAADRAEEARRAIAQDGAYQRSSRDGTFRPHPAIGVERESSRTAMRALRELGLDVDDEAPPMRQVV